MLNLNKLLRSIMNFRETLKYVGLCDYKVQGEKIRYAKKINKALNNKRQQC